jgi:putative flippase GtrA
MLRKKTKKLLKIQFFRYLIAGAVNTLISYLVFSTLLWFGLNFIFSGILASIISLVINFNTIARFVFSDFRYSKLIGFTFVFILSLTLNLVFMKIISLLGFNYYISAAIVAFPVALITYFLNRFFVF